MNGSLALLATAVTVATVWLAFSVKEREGVVYVEALDRSCPGGGLTATSHGIAQQATPKIKNVPVQQTSAASGQQMFTTYCAACHGADGRGDGPAAKAMKIPPLDLTTLSKEKRRSIPVSPRNLRTSVRS